MAAAEEDEEEDEDVEMARGASHDPVNYKQIVHKSRAKSYCAMLYYYI